MIPQTRPPEKVRTCARTEALDRIASVGATPNTANRGIKEISLCHLCEGRTKLTSQIKLQIPIKHPVLNFHAFIWLRLLLGKISFPTRLAISAEALPALDLIVRKGSSGYGSVGVPSQYPKYRARDVYKGAPKKEKRARRRVLPHLE